MTASVERMSKEDRPQRKTPQERHEEIARFLYEQWQDAERAAQEAREFAEKCKKQWHDWTGTPLEDITVAGKSPVEVMVELLEHNKNWMTDEEMISFLAPHFWPVGTPGAVRGNYNRSKTQAIAHAKIQSKPNPNKPGSDLVGLPEWSK